MRNKIRTDASTLNRSLYLGSGGRDSLAGTEIAEMIKNLEGQGIC